MASTYTTNGGIELIGTGEQSGTWGDTTNTNLEIIDRLTNGVGAISLSGTTHTLTTSDGALSDGQYKVLVFGGSPSGTNTVTITPNTAQHVYVVKNNSGQSVVLTQGSGGNVTVANGKSAIVYADGAGSGAAVVDVTSTFNFVSSVGITAGALIDVTGSPITSSGNMTVSVDLSELADMTATMVGTDELVVLDAGAQRRKAANEIGLSIFNNDAGFTSSAGSVTSVSGTGTVNGISLSGTVTSSGNLTLGGTLSISNADWSGTDLSVSNGGTGASSFTANNVLLGNGTSSFQTVAPGTSGNVLTSNGTTWQSVANTGISTGKAIAMAIVFG